MKIIVCVKQVPEITDVKVNPETGTLIREGVASILNPFCEYALDFAVQLKKKHAGIRITAISMGPSQAKTALMRCLELGADEAFLASDFKFAGADTWATARTLAATIRAVASDYDLILVGKQAIDGDTAQVGPELAEILSIPQVMYGVQIRLAENLKRVQVKRETEHGYEVVQMRLPGIVSAGKGSLIRRMPSVKDILDARRKKLHRVEASALDLPDEELGLQGSPTQVVKVFAPEAKTGGKMIDGADADAAAEEILAFLSGKNIFSAHP
ncbi:MAG: electron transfer flavoprotein subunit beta/FixA family protein [Desulfobacterales bacterium]|nr:electron transfer flavoprotein subunit beta/FixA family protein [Desulfobacterales bacterium]